MKLIRINIGNNLNDAIGLHVTVVMYSVFQIFQYMPSLCYKLIIAKLIF